MATFLKGRFRKGRGVLFFYTEQRVLKLFSPFGPMPHRQRLEHDGNRDARADRSWRGRVNPLKKIPFGFSTPRGTAIQLPSELEDAEQILWNRFVSYQKSGPFASANSLFSEKELKLIAHHGREHLSVEKLLAFISGLNLPVASVHGDAHQDNFLRFGNDIRLIDWTGYRQNNSPIFDLLYWYADRHRRQHQNNDPHLDFHDQVLRIPPQWSKLAPYYPNIETLQIYFLLTRVSIKLSVKRSPEKPKNSKIIKPLITIYKRLEKQEKGDEVSNAQNN